MQDFQILTVLIIPTMVCQVDALMGNSSVLQHLHLRGRIGLLRERGTGKAAVMAVDWPTCDVVGRDVVCNAASRTHLSISILQGWYVFNFGCCICLGGH